MGHRRTGKGALLLLLVFRRANFVLRRRPLSGYGARRKRNMEEKEESVEETHFSLACASEGTVDPLPLAYMASLAITRTLTRGVEHGHSSQYADS